jgi:hypothetical protein
MKRINIKQEYEDYKKRIKENYISYVRYWELRVIEWKTWQELLEYKKYWTIKKEYNQYKLEWWTISYWRYLKRFNKSKTEQEDSKYWSIKREYDKYKLEWWTLLYWWFFKRLKKWKPL